MELTGPIRALAHLEKVEGAVAIYTDSTYVIRGVREWIPNWKRRGWKTMDGKDVLNRELWEELWDLVQRRPSKVEWHYVRGHTGIPGNERVDEIATAYAVNEDPGLYEGPVQDYPLNLLDLPADTSLPVSSGSGGKNKAAYSYLSLVDGVLMRHATWAECEKRVKGRSGARFKMAASKEDEASILKSWGK